VFSFYRIKIPLETLVNYTLRYGSILEGVFREMFDIPKKFFTFVLSLIQIHLMINEKNILSQVRFGGGGLFDETILGSLAEFFNRNNRIDRNARRI